MSFDPLGQLRVIWSRHHRLRDSERAVLTVLVLRRNKNTGQCNPGGRSIAADTGMSLMGVQRIINRLEAAGIITRLGCRGQSTQYVVDLTPLAGDTDEVTTEGGQSVTTEGGQSEQGEVTTVGYVGDHLRSQNRPPRVVRTTLNYEGTKRERDTHAARAPHSDPSRKRKAPVDTWPGPNPEHRAQAESLGHDVDELADTMRAYAEAEGVRRADWDRYFADWIDRERPSQESDEPDPGELYARRLEHDLKVADEKLREERETAEAVAAWRTDIEARFGALPEDERERRRAAVLEKFGGAISFGGERTLAFVVLDALGKEIGLPYPAAAPLSRRGTDG